MKSRLIFARATCDIYVILSWILYTHTMAEKNLHQNAVTEDRIQSLVRGIVGEFFTSNVRSTQREQSQQFLSLDDEVNHRFRLPRSSTESPDLTDASSGGLDAIVSTCCYCE